MRIELMTSAMAIAVLYHAPRGSELLPHSLQTGFPTRHPFRQGPSLPCLPLQETGSSRRNKDSTRNTFRRQTPIATRLRLHPPQDYSACVTSHLPGAAAPLQEYRELGSNQQPQPYQDCALPLSYPCIAGLSRLSQVPLASRSIHPLMAAGLSCEQLLVSISQEVMLSAIEAGARVERAVDLSGRTG